MRRVDERLQALDAAYGPFGTHNETHNHVNKRFDTLEAAWREFNASRAPRLEERVAELEAMHIMEPTPAPEPMLSKHWRVDADGSIDASVQLRRDVGKLVRAARELSRFVKAREFEGTKLAQKVADVDAATELFAGDFE
jgi:hypothetical protein